LLILKRITLRVDVTKTVLSFNPFVFVNVKLKQNCYAATLLYKDESKKVFYHSEEAEVKVSQFISRNG
jgi:hypothetical protein